MTTPSRTAVVTRSLAVLATFGLLAAACGGGDSARSEAVDRIVDEGLSRDVAECVVDATADAFGEEALAEDYEGSPEQLDQTFEILDNCLFGG